ncbi:MAG: helix-turn-helix domain-containing protein, partial [Planctomycetes bacterium]|nr:helix-turn-helix domain-containing protein [Planctomycetota bacterium]
MIDKIDVAKRFLDFHSNMTYIEIAKKYGVSLVTALNWGSWGTPSWKALKYFCDCDGISWDWLLDGKGPMIHPAKTGKKPRVKRPEFSTYRLNNRFLKLFQGMKYRDIAAELDVTSSVVSEWRHGKSQVPWKRLAHAVPQVNVRWAWLIAG